MNRLEQKKKFIINIIYYGIILIIAYYAIDLFLPMLMPFLLAFGVAWLLKHPAGFIAAKLKCKRKWIIILFVILFYASLGLGAAGIGMKSLSAAGNFVLQLPNLYYEKILPFLNQIYHQAESLLLEVNTDMAMQWEAGYEDLLQNLGQLVSNMSMSAVQYISDLVASIPSLFIKMVITIVATFFMAGDYDKVTGFLNKLIPEKKKKTVINIKNQVKETIWIYIRSYTLLLLITFTELCAGLLLLQIPNAIVIAAMIALFDILPVLGTGGILIPWAILSVFSGNYQLAIGLIILYIIITAIRNAIEPRIVGKQIGLHPIATLISMFVGAGLFGIIGLFGLPVILSVLLQMEKNGVFSFHDLFGNKKS